MYLSAEDRMVAVSLSKSRSAKLWALPRAWLVITILMLILMLVLILMLILILTITINTTIIIGWYCITIGSLVRVSRRVEQNHSVRGCQDGLAPASAIQETPSWACRFRMGCRPSYL